MGKSTTSRLASPIPLGPQQSSQLGARHFTDPLSRPGPPADAMTSALQQTTPAALILHLPSSNHPAPLTMRSLDSHTAPTQSLSAKALCFTQEERVPVNTDLGQMGSVLQYSVEGRSMKTWLQSHRC
ncbi:hypothetical protein DPX16_6515 [Anabarilius grahami]|uniref:Uncharacterized protein n=1 Tax=Anabarilius grahami TaxID=495550 RepID=A0A3N0XXU3_ANAGA|nr:hypothetical protein DPX16_6515 [Anabarilius grahami]